MGILYLISWFSQIYFIGSFTNFVFVYLYLSLHVVPFPSINNVMLGPTSLFGAGLKSFWRGPIHGNKKSRDFSFKNPGILADCKSRDPARACQAPSFSHHQIACCSTFFRADKKIPQKYRTPFNVATLHFYFAVFLISNSRVSDLTGLSKESLLLNG